MSNRKKQDEQLELDLFDAGITPELEAAVANCHGEEAARQLLRHEAADSQLEIWSMLDRALEVLTPDERGELYASFGVSADGVPDLDQDGRTANARRVRRHRMLARVRQYVRDQGWDGPDWGMAA